MTKAETDQTEAESRDKAMDALLLAHNAILKSWFEQWAAEHQARVDSAFDRRDLRFTFKAHR
jgi:hypothetical protein